MAAKTGRGGTVRGRKGGKGGKANADSTQAVDAGGAPRVPADAAAPAGGSVESAMFDQIAQAHNDIMAMTGGIPPDLTGAVNKLVEQGFSPDTIASEMKARNVDVSQFLQNVTPTAPADVPPTNMGADSLRPVEPVDSLPDPDSPVTAAPAATPASKDTPFDRAYRALAEARYTEDQILAMTPDEMMRTAARENPAAFPEYAQSKSPAPDAAAPTERTAADLSPEELQKLQDFDLTDEQIAGLRGQQLEDTLADIAKWEEKNGTTVGESRAAMLRSAFAEPAAEPDPAAAPARTGPLADNEQAALRAQLGDDFNADGMDPNDLQAMLRIMRQRAQKGLGPTSVLSALREPSASEVAYNTLAQRGLPDSVLSRMTEQQMMEMAGTLPPLPPAPAASPVGRLVEPAQQPAPAPAQMAQQAPASPAPPPPEPAATTSPVAGLSDAARVLSEEPEALDMPPGPAPRPNPYGSDIYTQLANATMGGRVDTRFSPEVAGVEPQPPSIVLQRNDAAATGPNVQVNLPQFTPNPIPPQVMDVGAGVPGGVGEARAPVQWRNEDGILNGAPQSAAAGGATGGRIIRALMGTPAQGDTPAQLGLLHPAWGQMFSGQDGGLVGKAARFVSAPRTLATAATIKFLTSNGGLIGQGGVAKQLANAVLYGTQGNQQDSQQGTPDYANNYEAALRRLSQPMSGPKQDLAPPMVPNYDRPTR